MLSMWKTPVAPILTTRKNSAKRNEIAGLAECALSRNDGFERRMETLQSPMIFKTSVERRSEELNATEDGKRLRFTVEDDDRSDACSSLSHISFPLTEPTESVIATEKTDSLHSEEMSVGESAEDSVMGYDYYRELFNKFDGDQSGDIDVYELGQVFFELFGCAPHMSLVQSLIKDITPHHALQFTEFVDLIEKYQDSNSGDIQSQQRAFFSEEEVEIFQVAFDTFDEDNSCTISMTELPALLKNLKVEMQDLNKLLKIINDISNDDNELDFFQFLQLMRRCSDEALMTIQEIKDKIERAIAYVPTDQMVKHWQDLFASYKIGDDCFDLAQLRELCRHLDILRYTDVAAKIALDVYYSDDTVSRTWDGDVDLDVEHFVIIVHRLVARNVGDLGDRVLSLLKKQDSLAAQAGSNKKIPENLRLKQQLWASPAMVAFANMVTEITAKQKEIAKQMQTDVSDDE